jgi:hypothetical protein
LISQNQLSTFCQLDRFAAIANLGRNYTQSQIMWHRESRIIWRKTFLVAFNLAYDIVTQAYLNDASEFDIMRQTRHKSLTTMRRYIRDHTLFRKNAAAKLGL